MQVIQDKKKIFADILDGFLVFTTFFKKSVAGLLP